MVSSIDNFKLKFEWVGQTHDKGHPLWVNSKTGEINWRSSTDVCRHGDGNLFCKAGHELVKFITTSKGFSCDICTNYQPQNTYLMGCRVCNVDLCASCYPLIEKNFKPLIITNTNTIKAKNVSIGVHSQATTVYAPRTILIQKRIRGYLAKKTFIKLKNKKRVAIAKIQINHARSLDGETPLLVATRNSNPDIVRALLNTGANVDAMATNGDTPLLIAIGKKDLELVKLLIKGGANVGLANKKGETPLFKACSINHNEIVNIILKV